MYAAIILLTISPSDCLSLMASPSYARRELGTAALAVRATRDMDAKWIVVRARVYSTDREVRMRCENILRRIARCPKCKGEGWWGQEWGVQLCEPCGSTGIWVPPMRGADK